MVPQIKQMPEGQKVQKQKRYDNKNEDNSLNVNVNNVLFVGCGCRKFNECCNMSHIQTQCGTAYS